MENTKLSDGSIVCFIPCEPGNVRYFGKIMRNIPWTDENGMVFNSYVVECGETIFVVNDGEDFITTNICFDQKFAEA